MKKIVFFVILSISTYNCLGQTNLLKQQCEQRDSIDWPPLNFKGFTNQQVKNTIIKEIHNNVVIDSFYFYIFDGDSIRPKYTGSIDGRQLKLNDTYQICVPEYPPYVLSNIKTILRTFSFFSRATEKVKVVNGCGIWKFDINGVTYKEYNPEFVKDSARVSN